MITAGLIVANVLGLMVGWLLCRWAYEQHLKIANDERKRLVEVLRSANAQQLALTARLNEANTALAASCKL